MDLRIVLQNVDENGVHMAEGEPPDATVQKIAASLLWLGEVKEVGNDKATKQKAAPKAAAKKDEPAAKAAAAEEKPKAAEKKTATVAK